MNIPEFLRVHELAIIRPGLYRGLKLLIPFFLGLLLIAGLWALYDSRQFIQIAGLILLYFIPPAGKETIIPAAIALGFPWQVICFAITFIDVISCLFMLWNFDLICRIPLIGRWIYYLVQSGSDYLSHHLWVEKFCFIGLTTFVFLPLQGSGAVGGSILGRILGMNPLKIFLAVTIGSTFHSIAIGVSMYALQKYLDFNLWYLVIPVLILVLVTSTISLVYYLMKKRSEPDTSV